MATAVRGGPRANHVTDVLITGELLSRPTRQPAFEAESLALASLAEELASSSAGLSHRVCELAISLCGADSAGVSLLSDEDGAPVFRWIAMAGVYQEYVGGTTPRNFSPCGTTLDRGSPQLYRYPERYFTYFAEVTPPIVEGLVVPFRVSGQDLGTIWVVSHNEDHRGFDAEDARILSVLGNLAGLALQQVQARERLLLAEEDQRRLIATLGLPVYTTDAGGRITQFNQPAVDLWGQTPEIGKDLWCGSWRIFSSIDGTPLPLEDCPMAITLREGRAVRNVEIIVERPDGRRSNVLPFPSPLHDPSGNLVGAVNILVDITDRKRGEEAAARLAAIIDSSHDAIIGKDLDGIVSSWNQGAEKIFGYKAEEIIGRSIRTIIPKERQEEEDYVLESLKRGERVDHFETVRRHRDGTSIDISLTVSPIRDGYNRVIGASKIARDISEKKAAEAAIKRALEVKDEFLSLVSHELRNPISTILGNGFLLLNQNYSLSEKESTQALQDIVAGAMKLEADIEHLLILTKLDSNSLDLEPISLPAIVTKGTESFMKARPIRSVSIRCDEALPPALGQEALVSLVFQNLLTNADKYSPPDTDIEVLLSVSGEGRPEVHVRDHGIGLEEQDMVNLFKPFYRSPSAAKQAKGLGLGLAVCKRIVEAQGGSIGASGEPGKGSDFFFSLSLAE